jgi:hypothetical protein
MPSIDQYEEEVLSAHEKGELQSVATNSELAKFKAAARATAVKARVAWPSPWRTEFELDRRNGAPPPPVDGSLLCAAQPFHRADVPKAVRALCAAPHVKR